MAANSINININTLRQLEESEKHFCKFEDAIQSCIDDFKNTMKKDNFHESITLGSIRAGLGEKLAIEIFNEFGDAAPLQLGVHYAHTLDRLQGIMEEKNGK